MSGEIAIGPLSLIPKGEGRTFEVHGKRVAIFHTRAGDVFAVQAECPHRKGPLADGLVGDTTVVCPLHDRVFDLKSGQGVGNDDCLAVYPMRLTADGGMMMEVEP